MKPSKKQRLESKGYRVGSAADFLGLTREEAEFVRVKLALASFLKSKRLKKNISQVDFAKQIQSSQSRVAKMEQGDATVSLDLLFHSLLALGVTRSELAKVIGSTSHS